MTGRFKNIVNDNISITYQHSFNKGYRIGATELIFKTNFLNTLFA